MPARRILAGSTMALRVSFGCRFTISTRRATLGCMTLNQQIQQLVSQFASDVESLVRTAAVSAVQDALGAPSASLVARAPRGAAKPRPAAKKATSTPSAVSAAPAKAKPARATAARVRRSPEQLEATAGRIVAHVSAHPGQGAEEIKKALGLTAAAWGGPLRLAIESKRIRPSGEKRATKYNPPGAVPPVKRVAK